MRTRTREVVRMLATFRHSAHCRRLRAASAAQAARDLANEESPDDEKASDQADSSSADERQPQPGKPHRGMH